MARKKPSSDKPKPRPAVLRPLGAQLRRLRHERRLSQEKLAELSGLNYKYIGRVELAKAEPGADVLVKLARGLGVPVGELFETITPSGNPPTWPAAEIDAARAALAALTDTLDRLLSLQSSPPPKAPRRANR